MSSAPRFSRPVSASSRAPLSLRAMICSIAIRLKPNRPSSTATSGASGQTDDAVWAKNGTITWLWNEAACPRAATWEPSSTRWEASTSGPPMLVRPRALRSRVMRVVNEVMASTP